MNEKQVYKKTFELFDGCCALCGSTNIAMHHIRYGGLYGGRKTYLGNVILLCPPHHQLVHTNKIKYMPMLIEIIDNKLKGE
jgi:5-methylcytosine-specific restriction endonuclease McrA